MRSVAPIVVLALSIAACGSSAPATPGGPGAADAGADDSPTAAGDDAGAPKADASAPSLGLGLGQSESGQATYYAATGAGNCGFDPTPNDLNVAAMNHDEYANSAACGACVRVVGPKGTVTVRIVDQCPECPKGNLDLSQEAFAQIADVSAGRVPITWQEVACDVTGNVAYHYKDGSSQYWTAIQVRNHRLPIAKLEIMTAGSYADVPRADYNYFVASSGAGPGNVSVRITAVDGQQLEDVLPPVSSDVTVPGSGQFK
jgi:expansin (peptidoglycan-binding protein)